MTESDFDTHHMIRYLVYTLLKKKLIYLGKKISLAWCLTLSLSYTNYLRLRRCNYNVVGAVYVVLAALRYALCYMPQ